MLLTYNYQNHVLNQKYVFHKKMNKNNNFLLAKLLQNDHAPDLKETFEHPMDPLTLQEIFTIYETEVLGRKDYEYTFYNIFFSLGKRGNTVQYVCNVVELWVVMMNSTFIRRSIFNHTEIVAKTTILYGKYSCEFRFLFKNLNWEIIDIPHFCFYDFLLINMALNVADLRVVYQNILYSASETPERFKLVTKSNLLELRTVLLNIYKQTKVMVQLYNYNGPRRTEMLQSKSQFVYFEDFLDFIQYTQKPALVLTNLFRNSKKMLMLYDTYEALWFVKSNTTSYDLVPETKT